MAGVADASAREGIGGSLSASGAGAIQKPEAPSPHASKTRRFQRSQRRRSAGRSAAPATPVESAENAQDQGPTVEADPIKQRL